MSSYIEEVDKTTVLWESVKIIFDDKCIYIFNDDLERDFENNCLKGGMTLEDCFIKAKQNGHIDDSIIVLSESFLDGDVYRYNAYDDGKWYRIGKLVGFA